MTDQHPITPPPELIEDWIELSRPSVVGYADPNKIATLAAQWGSDQELEACCEWASQFNYDDYRYQDELQSLRRPKPPSLKEQALAELDLLKADATTHGLGFDAPAIRRALEALDD